MKKKRLIRQFFISYQILVLTSLSAVSLYTFYSVQHFFHKQTAVNLEERAKFLSIQINEYLFPLDEKKIDALCKSIGNSAFTRITVILPYGRVIGDSDEEPSKMDNHANRPEVVKALKGNAGFSTRYSRTLKKNIIYAAIPLKHDNKITAVLRTSVSEAFLDKELKSIQGGIILMGMMIALIAAGVSLFISKRIIQPIVEIKQGAELFARGDLNHRLYVSDSVEIGELAEAMNRMAMQLDERIQTILSQRNELDAVLSSMREGIMAIDLNEHLISINNAGAEMFDIAETQNFTSLKRLTGRSIQEVIRNPELHKFVKKALKGEDPSEEDILFYHNDERILNTHHSPLCDAKGKRIGTLIVFNDVTRLRQLENIRRDFAANVSHEIKTPLTAIKGFVETLQHGALENHDEAIRFLGIIEKHVDRLDAIIEDLMNLSRIEQERRDNEITLERGNIKEIIQGAVYICQSKADEKGIKIALDSDDDIMANINPPLLEQAAVNLLDNAIKYSEKNSTLHVKIRGKDTGAEISFQDHGIGIAKEHLPRLFERFYRVDKARSRKLGGTGLGLAIVKHIVQYHGGTVNVESSQGKGSTFIIHLPKG